MKAADNWVPYDDDDSVPDGEYLCFVLVPARKMHCRTRPAHTRYMHLEYRDGGFWVNNGQPKGFVKCYAKINPPSDALLGWAPQSIKHVAAIGGE